MASMLPSDEVAEDYKSSLEDLSMNSRYEISNLTMIAKENLDHAMAIARVLENHIKTTSPNKKLPALYVLDSIVKNVGTPYTLFFGRNLFQTFMTAYSLVDQSVRRKLEEMLKTWKEPVPGSIDSRPTFPSDVTRPIENALIKARTAAVQLQQQQTKSQQYRSQGTTPPPAAWRETPPLPRPAPVYGNVPEPAAFPQHVPNQSYANYLQPYPTEQRLSANPQQNTLYNPVFSSIDSLNKDISLLIDKARAEFAVSPYETAIQQRLKALLDLQEIVQSQQLPMEQIERIREQVSVLSIESKPPIQHQNQAIPNPYIQSVGTPTNLASQTPNASLFPPGALAALLASTVQKPTPPPQPTPLQSAIPNSRLSPTPSAKPNNLLESLRVAGLLPGSAGTPLLGSTLPVNSHTSNPPLTPPIFRGQSSSFVTPQTQSASFDVSLTSISLKESRPHLISLLYEDRLNQCATCGRRFFANDEGKAKKARHLDWHFRVNQRMVDALRRGQSRSWYLDEREWIKYRENDEQDEDLSGNGGNIVNGNGTASASAKKDAKKKWIPVPNDPALASLHCPICQEKFATVWLDEAQEWVWMDAIKVGPRIYHASCFEEATIDRTDTPARNLTPDSVLGKRKAEDDEMNDFKSKLKREPE